MLLLNTCKCLNFGQDVRTQGILPYTIALFVSSNQNCTRICLAERLRIYFSKILRIFCQLFITSEQFKHMARIWNMDQKKMIYHLNTTKSKFQVTNVHCTMYICHRERSTSFSMTYVFNIFTVKILQSKNVLTRF